MATVPQKPEKPKLPEFPQIDESKPDTDKVDILIEYIKEVGTYLEKVKKYITPNNVISPNSVEYPDDNDNDNEDGLAAPATTLLAPPPAGGGKKKQRKAKKKGGADIDYSKVYNVQGLIENISKSTGKDPVASQSVPAPFSTGSPLQRLGKKEAKSLPNELKNEIIPDYSQDGGKKKKAEKKKMPKKK